MFWGFDDHISRSRQKSNEQLVVSETMDGSGEESDSEEIYDFLIKTNHDFPNRDLIISKKADLEIGSEFVCE